jgi:hypothetical protein
VAGGALRRRSAGAFGVRWWLAALGPRFARTRSRVVIRFAHHSPFASRSRPTIPGVRRARCSRVARSPALPAPVRLRLTGPRLSARSWPSCGRPRTARTPFRACAARSRSLCAPRHGAARRARDPRARCSRVTPFTARSWPPCGRPRTARALSSLCVCLRRQRVSPGGSLSTELTPRDILRWTRGAGYGPRAAGFLLFF